MMKIFEGDWADRTEVIGLIGLIRQGFARVGLEADQPDCDRVSSDQADRGAIGQIRDTYSAHFRPAVSGPKK